MREWVVGFLFNDDASEVVLIRKRRPEWQAGKLNGVGGKIEDRDWSARAVPDVTDSEAVHAAAVLEAMIREFFEETGVVIPDWHHFASLTWEEGVVHFLRAFMPQATVDRCRTTTDESVERHSVHRLGEPGDGLANVTPNLLWLVPLAAHRHDSYDLIDVVETGTVLRKPGRLDVLPGGP